MPKRTSHTAQLSHKEVQIAAAEDASGNTALHDAVMRGDYTRLRKLLFPESGERLDVNVQNAKGNTALHLACAHSHFALIPSLLEADANANILNDMDKNPEQLIGAPQNKIFFAALVKLHDSIFPQTSPASELGTVKVRAEVFAKSVFI